MKMEWDKTDYIALKLRCFNSKNPKIVYIISSLFEVYDTENGVRKMKEWVTKGYVAKASRRTIKGS